MQSISHNCYRVGQITSSYFNNHKHCRYQCYTFQFRFSLCMGFSFFAHSKSSIIFKYLSILILENFIIKILYQTSIVKLDNFLQQISTIILRSMQQRKNTIILQTNLNCCKDNNSIFICTNDKCHETAFMCNNDQCDCIKSKHYGCSSHGTKYILNSIEKQGKDITAQNQEAFDSVIKVYDQMLQKLSKDRQEYVDYFSMFGLGKSTRAFVNLINDGNFKQITGDLAHQVHLQITQRVPEEHIQFDKGIMIRLMEQSNKQFNKMIAGLEKLRTQKLFQTKSFILKEEGFKNIANFMPKKVKQFKLLYRGSKYGYSAKKFHEICDNVPETITVVETEFGKIIGGYTPVMWQSSQVGNTKADNSGQSFMFSVTLNQKYPLTDPSKAVRHRNDLGPSFGGGYDLKISNQCHINNSYTNFPSFYNNNIYHKNQKAITEFCGQTGGNTFKIKQYEVFQIVWE